MTKRNAVFPANRQVLYEAHGYSAAVASGDRLFVSGQAGSRSDGSPEPDVAAQVRLALSCLEATLPAGGCTFGDIVDVIALQITNAFSPIASNPAAFANRCRVDESTARFAPGSA
jgi:enamine deaminase RidA (YjgF/YER057c/UK114 family)